MWTTTTLLTRNVDDFRQIDNGKVQERGMLAWCSDLEPPPSPYALVPTLLCMLRSRCYARRRQRPDAAGRQTSDTLWELHHANDQRQSDARSWRGSCLSRPGHPLPRRAGPAPSPGLAMLGEAGWPAFSAHPARVALAVVLFVLAGVSLFAGGNLRRGLREARGNRWVLVALGVLRGAR